MGIGFKVISVLVLSIFLVTLISAVSVEAKKWYEYIPGLAKLLGKDKDKPAPPTPPPAPTCMDSDLEDYYFKGHLVYANNPLDVPTQYDNCKDDKILIERVCNSPTNSTENYKEYNCPYGCLDGACLVPELTKIADIPNQEWGEDTIHRIDLKQFFSVPEGVSLLITAPASANIAANIQNGVVDFSPKQDFSGEETVTVSAYPHIEGVKGRGFVNDIKLVVKPVNDPPKSSQIPDIKFKEKVDLYRINLNNYFGDVDSSLNFSASSSSSDLGVETEYGSDARIFKINPDFYGEADITFTASDGEFETSQKVKVTAPKPPEKPVVVSTQPTPTPSTTPQTIPTPLAPSPTPTQSLVTVSGNPTSGLSPASPSTQPQPTVSATPNPQRTCSAGDFDFKWSDCVNGWQEGIYTKKEGVDCVGGEPSSARQVCVYTPPEPVKPTCTDASYILSSSGSCQPTKKKTETYTKIGECEGEEIKTTEVDCVYIQTCNQNSWQPSDWKLSCGTQCEYSRTWTSPHSCIGTFGKPSDETRLHPESMRKNGYYLKSVDITDETSAIPMGNAVLIPGGKTGEVYVDYMKLVVKDDLGTETVIAEDNFDQGTIPYGGSWTISDWFKGKKIGNQSIFHVEDGNLIAPVSKYPDQVLHPWGTKYPRYKIPVDSKTIEMRARVKSTGDASWQWGLDFYKNSTADALPMKEGGISDWYFSEHEWVDVTVGPVALIKPACTSNSWTSSLSACVNSVQTKTYSKKLGANCEGQKPADEIINCNLPPLLKQNIPDQTWSEDSQISINLTQYFSDDGVLSFSASPVQNIQIQISNGIASLVPDKDFYGTRTVVFTATDIEGLSVDSNSIILNVNPLPETEGSIITQDSQISTDSSVLVSSVKASTVTSSNIELSTISQQSNIQSSTISNSDIIQSSLLNSKIFDSFIDPSTVTRSSVSVSDIIDSEVLDSIITRSTIKNMKVRNAIIEGDFLKSGTIEFEGKTYIGPVSFWNIQNPVLDNSNVFIQGDKLIVNDFSKLVISDIQSNSNEDCYTKSGSYSEKRGIKFEQRSGKPRIVGTFNGWSTDQSIIGTINWDKIIFDIDDFNLPDGTYSFDIKYSEDGSPVCKGQWFWINQKNSNIVKNIGNNTHKIVVKIKNKIPYLTSDNPVLTTENVLKDWVDESDLIKQGNMLTVKNKPTRIWYKNGQETKYDPIGKRIFFTGYFDGWQKLLPASVDSAGNILVDISSSSYPVGSIFAGGFVSEDGFWLGLSNKDPQNIRVEDDGKTIYFIFEKATNGIIQTTKPVDKNKLLLNDHIDDSRIKINGLKLEIDIFKNNFYKNNHKFIPDQLTDMDYWAVGHFNAWSRNKKLTLSGAKLILDLSTNQNGVYAFAITTDRDEWVGIWNENQKFVRNELEPDGNRSYWIVIEKKIVNGVQLLSEFTGSKIPRETLFFDPPEINPDSKPPSSIVYLKDSAYLQGDKLIVKWVDNFLVSNINTNCVSRDGVFFENVSGKPRIVGDFNNWLTDMSITGSVVGDSFIFDIDEYNVPDGTYLFDIKFSEDGVPQCTGQWLWAGGAVGLVRYIYREGNWSYHLVVKIKDKMPYVPDINPTLRSDDVRSQMRFVNVPITQKPESPDVLNSLHVHLDNGELFVKEWVDNKVFRKKGEQELNGVLFENTPGQFVLKIGYSNIWSGLEIPGKIEGDKIVFDIRSQKLPGGDYPINLLLKGNDGSEQWFHVEDTESRIVKKFDYYRLSVRSADNGDSILYSDGSLNIGNIESVQPKQPTVVVPSEVYGYSLQSLYTDFQFFKWAVFGSIGTFDFDFKGMTGESALRAYWDYIKTNDPKFLESIWASHATGVQQYIQLTHPDNWLEIINNYNSNLPSSNPSLSTPVTISVQSPVYNPPNSFLGSSETDDTIGDESSEAAGLVMLFSDVPKACNSGVCLASFSLNNQLNEISDQVLDKITKEIKRLGRENKLNPIQIIGDEVKARADFERLSNGGELFSPKGYKGEEMRKMLDGSRRGFRKITSLGEVPTIDIHDLNGVRRIELKYVSKAEIVGSLETWLKLSGRLVTTLNVIGDVIYLLWPTPLTDDAKYLEEARRQEELNKITFSDFEAVEIKEDPIDRGVNSDIQSPADMHPKLKFVLTKGGINNGNRWFTSMVSWEKGKVLRVGSGIWNKYIERVNAEKDGFSIEGWYNYLPSSDEIVVPGKYSYVEFKNIYTGRIGRIYHFTNGAQPIVITGLDSDTNPSFENDFAQHYEPTTTLDSDVYTLQAYINSNAPQVVLASVTPEPDHIFWARTAIKLMSDYTKSDNEVLKRAIQYAFYNIAADQLRVIRTTTSSASVKEFVTNALKSLARIAPRVFGTEASIFVADGTWQLGGQLLGRIGGVTIGLLWPGFGTGKCIFSECTQ